MKMTTILKYASLTILILGIAVGCSSTSQESACTPQQAKDAIAAAKAANERAKSMDNEWRDTAKIIEQAEKAQADGKCEEAVKLANQARNQAENAVAQAEKNKQNVAGNETPAPMSNTGDYSVVKGDNLWNIAAKPNIYNNPFEWPLIYKANSGKIKDADLIYPGQVFAINSNPSTADVAAAINHDKSRGT